MSPLAGDGREGGIQNILRTIKRRQTLFLFTSALVSGALAVNTIRERIFSPVYQGAFQLQISSPFDEGGSPVAGDGGKLEAIARYKQRIDVPSLIVLLRSPYLISPVATRLGPGVGRCTAACCELSDVVCVVLYWYWTINRVK
jgi:hypothetical protein